MSAVAKLSSAQLEAELAREIAAFTHDPEGFALFAYPWGEGDLADSNGPREWQRKVNAIIQQHLSDPETRFQPCRIAVSSGHGIGKSAEVGMLIDWALSTCEDAKALVTAGTGTQLATKTVPEAHKWFQRGINDHWWDLNATSIRFKTDKRQANWRSDFTTWSEHNTDAFAGLHNKGKRILLIFDEASAIADRVWEVAEGAMTDENTEIIWLAFGNPTRNEGRFRECFGKFKHRWYTLQIDSRQVEGTNKAQIEKWIADYGEDSDFVRVRVRGEFPRAGSTQFIAGDTVQLARHYRSAGHDALPKIMSVDVARFGDDRSVIGDRQGRKARIRGKYRGLDTVQLAERVIEALDAEAMVSRPYDALVIDGDGIGAGVVDHLRHRGYDSKVAIFEFHGGATPNDPAQYFNKRAECWGTMREWLRAGAEIPDDAELADDLTQPQYGFSNKQQIQLEKKEDMKRRGLASPDCGDMLAMTFGVKVAARPAVAPAGQYNYSGESAQGWMG